MPRTIRGFEVTARVSPYSVKRIARDLEAEVLKVNKFSEELGKTLAELAADYAQERFDNAEYDGVNDVKVYARQTEKGNWSITADGQATAFIEFGTGVTLGGGYPGNVPAYYDGIGNYGKGRGKQRGWSFTIKPGTEFTASGDEYRPRANLNYRRVSAQVYSDETKRWHKESGSFWENMIARKGGTLMSVWEWSRKTFRNFSMSYKPGTVWGFTRGNRPNACMYHAMEDVTQRDFNRIVKEVRDAEL